MKRWIEILKQYHPREVVVLFYALLLDWFYKRIPRKVFLIKNTYDYILRSGGTARRVNTIVSVELNATQYMLRMEGSDFDVFNQIIINKELQYVVDQIRKLEIVEPYVVDCGANIGLSTSFFKQHFPGARIIAIEPNQDNFKLLCDNVEANKFVDVSVMKLGVWYKSALLTPDNSFRDKSNWSFALREPNNSVGSIRVDTLDNILRVNTWTKIDVLKIDIEGSEFDLFRNLESWQNAFNSVKIISVEIHEEIGQRYEIEGVLTCHGFQIARVGELTIGVRNCE